MIRNEEFISNLCTAFASLSNEMDMRKLLDDVCTYKEVEQMAQRLAAAQMLSNGSTYKQIIAETDISSATLSRVSKCLKHGSGGYKKVII